ncbi:glutathione S-transferase kappa 1-like [Brevipalpus obovatus]|uniref:glutathione S-transferase kappa 1-like n=1 Tax=Brevipalpus obovatus TaxID=246614 RepID=UPI003D9E3ECB
MSLSRFPVYFYYDVISPYSWIAFELLNRYSKVWEKMELVHKPSSIYHIFNYSKNPSPLTNSLKLPYQMRDIHMMAKYCKVPLRMPSNFMNLAQTGSFSAMMFTTAVDFLSEGKDTAKISRALWGSTFCNDPAPMLDKSETWLKAAASVNLDHGIMTEAIVQSQGGAVKARVKAVTKEAVEKGAFGLPFILVHTSEGMIPLFGCDRIEQLAYLIGEKYYGPHPTSDSS